MINTFFAAACTPPTDGSLIGDKCLPHGGADLTIYFNIAFGVLGAIAFLTVVVGGLRYITASAQNDPTKITESKKMIIYSLVGIAVALCAAAIVNFVLAQTKN